MVALETIDWMRALICLLFLEGLGYLIFAKVIQNFAVKVLSDAPIGKLRLFGVFLMTIGFLLWTYLSKVSGS